MDENAKTMVHEEKFHDKKIGPCWVSRDMTETTSQPLDLEKVSNVIYTPGYKKTLLNEIISTLDSAEEQICASSFLLSDKELVEAFLRAASRGVDVYLLTASEIKLASLPAEDNEFQKKTVEEHKKLLDLLVERTLVRTAEHLHSKFILVDPKRHNSTGFLLTCNLTTEALTRNPEIVIRIDEKSVKELFAQFCIGFWNESERELLEKGKLSAVGNKMREHVPDTIKCDTVLCTTRKMHTIKDGIFDLVHNSKGEILVSSYGFEQENHIVEALLSALKKGRKVTVITRPRASIKSRDALIQILQEGGEVYGLEWLHAKCVIAGTKDDLKAVVMTANLEKHGIDDGFESGILLKNKDASDLKSLFESWISMSQYYLSADTKRGDVTGTVKLWEGENLVERIIEPVYENYLGQIRAKKGKKIDDVKPKKFPWPKDPSKMYHMHRFTWDALPAAE